MWELYSGEALYEGMTVGQVLYAVVYDAKRPPIPDGCPPEYAALMRDCWKGDPVDRCACRAARRPCKYCPAVRGRRRSTLLSPRPLPLHSRLTPRRLVQEANLHLWPRLTPHPR